MCQAVPTTSHVADPVPESEANRERRSLPVASVEGSFDAVVETITITTLKLGRDIAGEAAPYNWQMKEEIYGMAHRSNLVYERRRVPRTRRGKVGGTTSGIYRRTPLPFRFQTPMPHTLQRREKKVMKGGGFEPPRENPMRNLTLGSEEAGA